MKIKRFQATDMRQALRQVRETLGPDAVILSNRKVDGGIELVAAVDFDDAAFAEAQQEQLEARQRTETTQTSVHVARMARAKAPVQNQVQSQSRPQPSPQARQQTRAQATTATRSRQDETQATRAKMPLVNGYRTQTAPDSGLAPPAHQAGFNAWDEELQADNFSASKPLANDGFSSSTSQIHVKPQARPKPRQEQAQAPLEEESGESAILAEMRREMENMKRMMQNEFSMLGWEEMGRKRPDAQELFRRLMSLDLSADLCHGLSRKVEQMEDADQAWRKALAILAASLPVHKGDILDEGGLVALVGPTGVGKTTSLAKLAARFCLRHGNRHLGLISADAWRLGGQEQLVQYARLLDVPVRSVNSTRDLEIAINAFADKRLVLIDTAGIGQRDARLAEQLGMIMGGRKPLRTFLTLSSNTQQAALEQAMQAFRQVNPSGCIITKVDEAASLGGVFSALIRQGLPLAFITDGQKVPEDIHLPRTQALVNRAVNMSQQFSIGLTEQFMAMSLGGFRAEAH